MRNRFFSAADGSPFRVAAERDANAEVHAADRQDDAHRELARHMITTSSNLATNLLLDLVGVETVQRVLDELQDRRHRLPPRRRGRAGVRARDQQPRDRRGLVSLLRLIEEEQAFSPELSREMLEILHQQEFKNGIPGAAAARGARRAQDGRDLHRRARRRHRLPAGPQAVHHRHAHRVGARDAGPLGDHRRGLAARSTSR